MWPSAYAPVTTVSPNAMETPTKPIPRFVSGRKFEAITAAPHPPNTSQNVPRKGAPSRRPIVSIPNSFTTPTTAASATSSMTRPPGAARRG
jgi:hypothetical protein